MNFSKQVQHKIKDYNPKGDLANTANVFLALSSINHSSTKEHVERVALLAEATAKKLKKDCKAALFAGLLHDIGKLVLPANLFNGHDINETEYNEIKTHALAGFEALKKLHLFTALCAGLHHNLYEAGYGLNTISFPKEWSPSTIKKVLTISAIVSICDFVDAYTHRTTKMKTSYNGSDLVSILYEKYGDDADIIEAVLSIHTKFL
jgi:putative nucleotidyltransferase with HDIG domain